MTKNTPVWIVVDGIDGAGKTTIISHIELYLEKKGYLSAVTKALGEGEIGQAIRKRLLNGAEKPCDAMQAIMLPMAITETYYEHIVPYLEKGISVITDRWIGSFIAYQVFAEDNKPALTGMCTLMGTGKEGSALIDDMPDIYFICDCPVEVAEERLMKRSNTETLTRLDKETFSYKNKVRNVFSEYVAEKFENTIVLDCNRSILDILIDVERHIDNYLSKRCMDLINQMFPLKEQQNVTT